MSAPSDEWAYVESLLEQDFDASARTWARGTMKRRDACPIAAPGAGRPSSPWTGPRAPIVGRRPGATCETSHPVAPGLHTTRPLMEVPRHMDAEAVITALRRQLQQQGTEYRVVKNTLTSLAAEKAEKRELSPLLKGPTALAFGYGDVVQLAKTLIDYQRLTKTTLSIKGGLLEGRVLSGNEIVTLSALPSREALIAKLMGTLYGPIHGLLYVLSAEMRQLLALLQARINQLEED